MSTAPFDTADARMLALVASQAPATGHAIDRTALITTILDACTEVERLRTLLAASESHVCLTVSVPDDWKEPLPE